MTAREAKAIYFTDGNSITVGATMFGDGVQVTTITVTEDLPGLHGYMERARVFSGDKLLWESPVHSLEGVDYFGADLQPEELEPTDPIYKDG